MLASWNVNSLRVRGDQVVDWLKTHQPDVLGLQETKSTDEQFPQELFAELGYHLHFTGQKTYNGVAMFAKHEPLEVINQLPTFSDDPQKRFMAMAWPKLWVVTVYVPNGSEVGSDKYAYKLAWLDALIETLETFQQTGRGVVVMGDFNIAPKDIDTYDSDVWSDCILVSKPERERLERLEALGFVDTFRTIHPDKAQYSWWDYRQARFRRGQGLRIDLVLATQGLVCQEAWVDEAPRAHERPSDHAPVVASFAGEVFA